MNREEIIKIARQSGVLSGYESELFQRFANLVAAAEREKCYEFIEILIDAEREAIIDIVAFHGGSVEIEAAIRARGKE